MGLSIDCSRPRGRQRVGLFWSWYNLLILALACFVAIEERQRRGAERFRAQKTFEVEAMGRAASFAVFDISVTGVGLYGQSPVPLNGPVTVRIGGHNVPGEVVRLSANSFAIKFDHSEETRAHLIRHVFSGSYHAAVDRVKVSEVTLGILSRIWR